MTVWVVIEQYSDQKTLMDFTDIVGVYSTEEKARSIQEELINQNARDVLHFDCDPIDVVIEEWEVE